jgi:AcrR family transcriptional regulator
VDASTADDHLEPTRPVRRQRLTRQRLVDAALQVASERGLEGVTMREVARRTGSTPMAAYHHVADRAELIRLVVNEIGARLELGPDDPDWDVRLRNWAHEIRAALGEYPGTAGWLLVNPPAGSQALVIVETALAALVDAGLDESDAAECYMVLANWVLCRCDVEDQRRLAGPATEQRRQREFAELIEGADPAQAPLSRRLAADFARLTPDAAFEAGLDLVLDGIRARMES